MLEGAYVDLFFSATPSNMDMQTIENADTEP
jgi:hypothetical protein